MTTVLLIYLGIGIIAGVLSGLLGIGGGVVLVPALVWAYQQQGMPPGLIMHLAAGTSLASIIISATVSLYGHLRHGAQIWLIYRRLVLGIAAGTVCGTLLANILHSRLLLILFGFLLLIIALLMLFNVQPKPHRRLPGTLGISGISLLIGAKSGLFGLGGGIITIPFLTYCNVSMRNAVGISIACSLTVAIIGTIGFILTGYHAPDLPPWSTGYIYWPAVLGIALISPICAQWGIRFSYHLPVTTLKKLFAVFLMLVALDLLLH